MPNERDVAHFRFRTSIGQVAAVNRKTAVSHGKLGLHNWGRLFDCDCCSSADFKVEGVEALVGMFCGENVSQR